MSDPPRIERMYRSWEALSRSPLWAPWIDEVWWEPARDESRQALILPDNCMDVLFDGERWRLIGAATCAYHATLGAQQAMFGVRFKPGVLPLLCELSGAEVLDDAVWFEDVCRGDVVDVLGGRLVALQGDVRLEIVRALQRTHANTVHELADELGWSTRHLRRVLPSMLGYSARTWLHVRRFQVMRQLLEASDEPCAVIAARAGYADQAHMTRMCKRLAHGATPRSLRALLAGS